MAEGTGSNTHISLQELPPALLAAPAVQILGGDAFFLPQADEAPIPGPVFPRGRGTGPVFRIQTGCDGALTAWITGPDGARVADLTPARPAPGNYEASWDWTSLSGWPVPQGIPVGQYLVHVRSTCLQDDAVLPFYIVFDPRAVGGPARFSFDRTTVWFGMGVNRARALHYYLRCSDWRVFRIAMQAAAGHTSPYAAATALARAEESLFGYSLDYQTNDVLDLLLNYSEAQCADDAACLISLLRATGIPAHPVTADAALETGAANWTFDTWVEFLADLDGVVEWRIFHPHEYPGMQAESRARFGTRGVANKGFNDLLIMANESWTGDQIDDGADDVAYGRNECGEPTQTISKASWVDELCESGYWTQAHWECDNLRAFTSAPVHGLAPGEGFRLTGSELALGGRLCGTVQLRNALPARRFGRLVVELLSTRMESMKFIEKILYAAEFPVAADPGQAIAGNFDFPLPLMVEPGRELYLRARLNEQSALFLPIRLPSFLQASLDMPAVWQEGTDQTIRLQLRNAGLLPMQAIDVRIDAPYALRCAGSACEHLAMLTGGEQRAFSFVVKPVAELSSGSLHVVVSSANAGGLMLRHPFRIEGQSTLA